MSNAMKTTSKYEEEDFIMMDASSDEDDVEPWEVNTPGHPMAFLDVKSQTADNMVRRCHELIDELDIFYNACAEKRQTDKLECRHFRNDAVKELKAMENLRGASTTSPARVHELITTSNLPFLEATWQTAKHTTGLVSLKRHSSPVDVVASFGLQWIKLSTITPNRLMMDIAKEGYYWPGEDSSDSEDVPSWAQNNEAQFVYPGRDASVPSLPLFKLAHSILSTASNTRIRNRHPKVHFVLPRLAHGIHHQIDHVLSVLTQKGIHLTTARDLPPPPPPIKTLLPRLLSNPYASFTLTVNIDCTLLLALTSDISHARVPPTATPNPVIARQIAIEATEKLLPSTLWPAMAHRTLLTTNTAATRMRAIVEEIGTESERARAALLLSSHSLPVDAAEAAERSAAVRAVLQPLSSHKLPDSWLLPVYVVEEAELPRSRLAGCLTDALSAMNISVFGFGWVSGLTTLTANRVAVKAMERVFEEEERRRRDEEGPQVEVLGPDVWVCATARSLVAKEKTRRDGARGYIAGQMDEDEYGT
ncbi:hypothetical protein EJ06DRAFT_512645 [Trichodelitschia bisporula]|uniref:DUF1308 domain-containing protein n=1 Tax=Trichodelitschia bisporula TaxID=703511 RepID=A0A6G1HRX1_9PEZI|nr:hypothetical protein EJ06DRAFT_512645 [Trichodelitschia bisporula]